MCVYKAPSLTFISSGRQSRQLGRMEAWPKYLLQGIEGQLFQGGQSRLLAAQGHEGDVEVVSEGRGFPEAGVVGADDQREVLGDERSGGVVSGVVHQLQNLNITLTFQDQQVFKTMTKHSCKFKSPGSTQIARKRETERERELELENFILQGL